MSELRIALEEYLAVRRALGFELRLLGGALHNFVSFLEDQGASYITSEKALSWATQPEGVQPATWANRLAMVRRFAQYRSTSDPQTEVPPQDLLPHRYRRRSPYIYQDEDIQRLLEAARQLPSAVGLRPCTYSTVFGLLTVTGMRISEPLALNCADVDLTQGVLTITQTKFGKSRLVPIHESTRQVLVRYARRRDEIYRAPGTPAFFVSDRGTRLTEWSVRWTFVQLSREIGLRGPSDSHGPRLHDLRHRFAIETLLHWYQTDVDVERHLPRLAAYLGHAHVTDTYWYLSATTELLSWASKRLGCPQGGDAP